MSATITIDATKVIKQFDKRLVGANIEWFENGNGIYDEAAGSLKPWVASASESMGVGILRFPGGTLADYYFWRDGVGPRATRPVRSNALNDGASSNNFGTPELFAFARQTGADILMQTNIITSTPQEAAAWVSYCNAPVNAQRAQDGFPNPVGVRYWEIGNEQYMSGSGSSTPASFLTAATYAQRLKLWASTMKSVDPTIKVGAVSGKNFGRYTFVEDPSWNATLLQQAAKQIDFIALHNAYGPVVFEGASANISDVYGALWAFPLLVEANVASIRQDIQTFAPTEANRIELAITEWGPLFHIEPSSPWIEHTKTMGSAVFVANLMQVFARTPNLNMATYFKLFEDSFMGTIQANGAVKPSYYALQMFGKFFGTNVVKTTVVSPGYAGKAVGFVAAVPTVPYLDVVTSLSADGQKMHIIAVNKNTSAPLQATLNVTGFTALPWVVEKVLTAPALDANNGPALPVIPGLSWATQMTLPQGSMFQSGAPGTVSTTVAVKTMSGNAYTFAPLSVTALELTRAN